MALFVAAVSAFAVWTTAVLFEDVIWDIAYKMPAFGVGANIVVLECFCYGFLFLKALVCKALEYSVEQDYGGKRIQTVGDGIGNIL